MERILWRDGPVSLPNRCEVCGPLCGGPSPIVASRFLIFHGRWPPKDPFRYQTGLVTSSPLIWIGAEQNRFVRWSVLARFTDEFPIQHAEHIRPTRPIPNDGRRPWSRWV